MNGDLPKDQSYAARVSARHLIELQELEAAAETFGFVGYYPWEDLHQRAIYLNHFLNPPEDSEAEAPDDNTIEDATAHREMFRNMRKAAIKLGWDSRPWNRFAGQADDILHGIRNLVPEAPPVE
jgi:hypothetical protein